jgi:hypothetical protein
VEQEHGCDKGANQTAMPAQQAAEASRVARGGTFYEVHCRTQQKYDEKRKKEAE